MKSKLALAVSLACFTGPCMVFGQGMPGSAALVPTTNPAAASAGPTDVTFIRLRALPAVLDARERRLDWHLAAEAVQRQIQGDALKAQLTQRLSGLAPRVARALVARPGEDAVVSISVFNTPGLDGKQALVAVTFDGLGSQLGGDYFGAVLAGEDHPPEAQDVPQSLVYDPAASSYLVFFLGKSGLEAGAISTLKMKQSILAAAAHQRQASQHENQLSLERANLQTNQAAVNAQEAGADQAAQTAAAQQPQQVIPEYPYGNNIGNNAYDDGYYYPGIGVPIVITGEGYANTPEWRHHQRQREEGLEKRYGNRRTAPENPGNSAAQNQNQNSVTTPQPAGVVNPPGEAGVRIPPGSAGLQTPPNSAGVNIGPTQGRVPQRAPAPAPAAHGAPPAPPPPPPPANRK